MKKEIKNVALSAIVIGEFAVGKTRLVRRLLGEDTVSFVPTMGMNFEGMSIQLENGYVIRDNN